MKVLEIFKRVTREEPKMWGPSIVGFGHRVLKYDSGREMDWMVIGFSPRKANIVLYLFDGFDKFSELLAGLGKHRTGVSCLYLKRMSDVDMDVLEELVSASFAHCKKN
ncbi:MAG: DUF1801 domain-containing protein [Blastocatellia bacterium]|nr:DUF1801 domain-containing protein [Blastocatellia bacterium]